MKLSRKLAALLVLLACALLAAPFARAQDDDDGDDDRDPRAARVQQAMQEAIHELEAKQYDAAIATLSGIEKDVKDWPEEARRSILQLVHYNMACAYSLKGEKEKGVEEFEKALANGFDDVEHIQQDPDLDNIRKEPRFQAALKKLAASGDESKAAALDAQKKEILGRISSEAVFPFDFDLAGIDGSPVRLADYRGKVVLVDVWGTWCPPCRAEVPHLVELHEKLSPKGFAIVGLNAERVAPEKAPEVVKAFIAGQKIPYRCALIDREFLKKIPDFEGFPTLLLIDRSGRVRLKQVGYTEGPVLEAAIEKLLAEPAAPGAAGKEGGEGGKIERF